MKSRSDLVVASGIGDGKRQGVRVDDYMNKSVGSGTGLSGIRVYQISKGYS
jgi:cobyric acid synthase